MELKILTEGDIDELRVFLESLSSQVIYDYGRWTEEEHRDKSKETAKQVLTDRNEIAVGYFEKGKLLGYGHLNTFNKRSRRFQASLGLVVHQDYHGKRIGRELLDFLLMIARRKGCKKVWAHIHGDNVKSLRLFAREGFQVEGLFRDDEWYNEEPISVISVAKFLEGERK